MGPRSKPSRKRLAISGQRQIPSVETVKIPICLRGLIDGTGNGPDGKPLWGLTLLDLDYDGSWSWRVDLVLRRPQGVSEPGTLKKTATGRHRSRCGGAPGCRRPGYRRHGRPAGQR